MKIVAIQPSGRNGNKFDAIVNGTKTVPFGAKGYSDFTIHKEPLRTERYIDRHSKHEDWTNPLTAGFYSRWLVWNKPSLAESIRDTNKRFNNIDITHKS